MPILPLNSFFCWSINTATFAAFIYIIITATVAALLEILDIAALSDPNFEIRGGFESSWRAHVWEGWLAGNIVMLVCHIIMIGGSILLVFAIKRFPVYYEYGWTKIYRAAMIIYLLIELGIGLYRYSWYGPNIFRLGYLVFTWFYWIFRFITDVIILLVLYSRICDLRYVLRYGQKRTIQGWEDFPQSELQSGAATPGNPLIRSGFATPSHGFDKNDELEA